MKKRLKIGALLITFFVTALCYRWGAQQLRHATFNARYSAGSEMRRESRKRTLIQQQEYVGRKRAFAQIWSARNQRNIVPELISFLSDPEMSLREQAVRALGRIESEDALPHLIAMKHQVDTIRKQDKITREQWQEVKVVPDATLDLAIGRIESKEKSGQDKLNHVLQSVDLQWTDLPPITQRAWYISDGTQPPPKFTATPLEKALIREIIDILYQMKANGQDISSWTKQLSLSPSEKVWLSTANMPKKEALQTLLDYISSLRVVREQDNYLINSIYLALGDEALSLMRQRLDYLSSHAGHPEQREGTVLLLRGVAYAGDFESLPVLNKFISSKDSYIKSEAQDSIRDIEQKKFYVYSPS